MRKKFGDSIAEVGALLANFDHAATEDTWRLPAGERGIAARRRAEFLRKVMLGHCAFGVG